MVGYGLGALTKPVFPLAGGWDSLVGARFVDRIGKGIRGARRDALVADVTPAALRGAAYGLQQTLDVVGAFLEPLLAVVLMVWTANHFQTVFWFAVLPAHRIPARCAPRFDPGCTEMVRLSTCLSRSGAT